MQREKVIELAKKSTMDYSQDDNWPFFTEELEEFARLVELETLERAARVCKDKSMKMENEASLADTQDDAISLRSSAWLISVCGHEIRNLKETHDKE